MQHLMLVSIGPVQEFIASARRSRDLWFGSWLLSELSKTAAHEIHRAGGTLIFPAPASPDDLKPDSPLNVANKILAELPDGSPTPDKLAQTINDALQARLFDDKGFWTQAYGRITRRSQIDGTAARAQIADMIEFTWVAVPLEKNKYADARAMLEHLLAARKATRSFAPVGAWSRARQPKSSLDGLRESVIPEEIYDQLNERDLFRGFGIRPGERLCGVGLLKRHGQRGKDEQAGRVFSTSHVAAQPFLARLKPSHRTAVERYIAFLKEPLAAALGSDELGNVPVKHPIFDRYDGHLLFEERLREYIPNEHWRGQAISELQELFEAITGSKHFLVQPYYALLLADGDGMGKAIDAQKTDVTHQALSQQLDSFARAAAGIVRDHSGSLVYAGGDDVLAFVPLHTVLKCARELTDTFATALSAYEYEDRAGKHYPKLSIGIAITHHLEPLADALELARKAEKKAKEQTGKNALALTLSKRSGEDRTVVGGWGDQRGTVGALDQRLVFFTHLFAAQQMPDGYAYEIQRLHRQLTPHDNDALASELIPPMREEAKRILERKRNDQGRTRLNPSDVQKIVGLIDVMSLDTLADELMIARTLAEAYRQANLHIQEEGERADLDS